MKNLDSLFKLTLMMSDFWINHMQDSIIENPDEEVAALMVEMSDAREQLLAIYMDTQKEQSEVKSIPSDIESFLRKHAPEIGLISVEMFDEKPLQYLVKTKYRMSRETAAELDAQWPDTIVLESAPI